MTSLVSPKQPVLQCGTAPMWLTLDAPCAEAQMAAIHLLPYALQHSHSQHAEAGDSKHKLQPCTELQPCADHACTPACHSTRTFCMMKFQPMEHTKYSTILCCAVLCCAVLCCAVLCCAVLCCAVLCCAVLCCAVLCCAVLCCAVLCCAVLCCAVLCCAVLCCAVLCCAALRCAALRRIICCKQMSDLVSLATGSNINTPWICSKCAADRLWGQHDPGCSPAVHAAQGGAHAREQDCSHHSAHPSCHAL